MGTALALLGILFFVVVEKLLWQTDNRVAIIALGCGSRRIWRGQVGQVYTALRIDIELAQTRFAQGVYIVAAAYFKTAVGEYLHVFVVRQARPFLRDTVF